MIVLSFYFLSIVLCLVHRVICFAPNLRTAPHESLPSVNVDGESPILNDEVPLFSKVDTYMSKPMQLYIEDTDSYQVKYNGNYIRSYERALFQISKEVKIENSVLNNVDFIISGVTQHKFQSSPRLGDTFLITAKLINQNLGLEEEWQLEMIDHNSHQPQNSSKRNVYNTAIVTVTSSLYKTSHLRSKPIRENYITSLESTSPSLTHTNSFYLHRDEFDSHIPNTMCMRTALNLFERTRSNALGGPHLLQKMQESGLLWVVTSIDDMSIQPDTTCCPGEEVTCNSIFEMKRKGMIMECKQEIRKVSNNEICAQGLVTLCAIDANTRKPTKNIPEFVRALFK